MFHRFVLLPCTRIPTAVAAFQEGETATTARHATAGASDYTPEDGEDNEPPEDDHDYDGPPVIC
jgi:hypothetical protein